jgi:hypothetical protein
MYQIKVWTFAKMNLAYRTSGMNNLLKLEELGKF